MQHLKLVFLGKKIWRNALALKSKKVQNIFKETFILILSFSAVFFYKTISQISFTLIHSGDKRLLSGFMRKWIWFHRHDIHFPKNVGSRLKFQKWDMVNRWKSNDCNNSISSAGKPLYIFACKRKEIKTHF